MLVPTLVFGRCRILVRLSWSIPGALTLSSMVGLLSRSLRWGTLCAMAIMFATTPTPAQEVGYSYLRIDVNGKAAQNLVLDPAYNGWIRILDVQARRRLTRRLPSSAQSGQRAAIAYGPWTEFSEIIRSGRMRAGKLEFGAGDDGQFGPLLDAQRSQVPIPNAVLDFYTFDKNHFVGEFEIKGIRILSLRDVPASACPMYEITMSFESITKK